MPLPAPRIGFAGLGDMGAACADALIGHGHTVTVWARRESTIAPFRDRGMPVAATLADLGSASDVVFICVVDDHDVEEMLAPGALTAGLAPGSVAVILSTISPETCQSLATRAAQRNVTVLDAPVTGGSARAREGSLTVMAGGDRGAYERCLPLLRTFGGQVDYFGGPGMGQIAKLINNFVFSANTLVAGEALDLAERLGITRAAMSGVLSSGSGQSFALASVDRLLVPESRGVRLVHKDAAILAHTLAASGLRSARLDRVLAALAPFAGDAGRLD